MQHVALTTLYKRTNFNLLNDKNNMLDQIHLWFLIRLGYYIKCTAINSGCIVFNARLQQYFVYLQTGILPDYHSLGIPVQDSHPSRNCQLSNIQNHGW